MAVNGALDLDLPQSPEGGAGAIARGVCHALNDAGYATLTEMRLGSGRRVDVIGLDRRGRFAVVEVKASPADFRADRKWPEYRRFYDQLLLRRRRGFSARSVAR